MGSKKSRNPAVGMVLAAGMTSTEKGLFNSNKESNLPSFSEQTKQILNKL